MIRRARCISDVRALTGKLYASSALTSSGASNAVLPPQAVTLHTAQAKRLDAGVFKVESREAKPGDALKLVGIKLVFVEKAT